MLTQDQLDQLKPLTEHPKFGKLLSDAIEVWKRDDVTPVYNYGGIWPIYSDKDTKIWKLQDDNKCCLIGASLTNKKYCSNLSYTEDVVIHFNVYRNEICSLISSFDDNSHSDDDEEAKTFALKVREIVNPQNYYHND
jgi:hypothetical protein